jgi:hypothetical protein
MSRPRPEWLERKIDYTLARQRARREHDQPCDCPYCLTSARVEELIAERIRLERLLAGEPPF